MFCFGNWEVLGGFIGEQSAPTFFIFSASRSYSSRTSCSRGVSSGGERRGLDVTWSIVLDVFILFFK